MKIKKVLISQPKPTSDKSPYYDIAEKYGVKIDFRPFIEVEGLSVKEFRQQKISILDYTAVIFTSRHSVDFFFSICQGMRIAIPETMKYFCMSETVALYIQKYAQYRKRKVFFGASNKLNDLLPIILKHNTEKYFIPVSEQHSENFDVLTENKINFKCGIMYRTVSVDFNENEISDYDLMIFFTPAGITSLLKNFPDFKEKDIRIGCLGPMTAKAIRDAGIHLDLEAPTPAAPSITAALSLYIKENNE